MAGAARRGRSNGGARHGAAEIRRGIARADTEGTLTQEQTEVRLAKWLSK